MQPADLAALAISDQAPRTIAITLANAPALCQPPRPVFGIIPDKPPLPPSAALDFLSAVVINFNKGQDSLVNQSVKIPALKPLERIFKFVLRPLQFFKFGDRVQPHHSIVMQMDGLLFACFRLRLERDVCSPAPLRSFCVAFGAGASPASTYCGLFMPHPLLLLSVVQAVKQERGYGIFVGPVVNNAWPLISNGMNASQNPSLLRFTFTGPDSLPWQGVFCSFAYLGKVKRKKKDVLFNLLPIFDSHISTQVAISPFCPARISSTPFLPVACDDTAKGSSPLCLATGIPKPVQAAVWCVNEMRPLAAVYPNAGISQMFMQAILPTGAPLRFVGDRSKYVPAANGALEPVIQDQIRSRFISEVGKGRMMGPFTRCPFPNEWCKHQARVTPLDTRRKDKYDPLSTRFRVISNFSSGRTASINSLIYSPKLISTHLQCAHLRDTIFSLGTNARFYAIDQEDAFRADQINLNDAHLYCYQVGVDWFIDLRDPFGNIKSEYTYAIIVAVLKYALSCDPLIVGKDSFLLGYVDNWFLLSKASCPTHDTRWQQLKDKFKRIGAPMHEEQKSTESIVNALGWDWDLKAGSFSCPEDKYLNCVRVSSEWAQRASADALFLYTEIDSLAGLFQWISVACPAIISAVASLQSLKHGMKKAGLVSRKLDDRCKFAVIDLAKFFASWSRTCPLFAGFSPTSLWEVLIKVDASTDFGMGGFSCPSFNWMIYAWNSEDRAKALAHSVSPIRESTTFFELLGILKILTYLAPILRGKRVQIESDNEAAIRDLICCFSGKPLCMEVIAEIRDLCAINFIIPRFEHILSQFNSIADRLSHDDFTQANSLCLEEFQRPLLSLHRL